MKQRECWGMGMGGESGVYKLKNKPIKTTKCKGFNYVGREGIWPMVGTGEHRDGRC